MPEENVMMTIAEAKRRKAIAEMIIAEIDVAHALRAMIVLLSISRSCRSRISSGIIGCIYPISRIKEAVESAHADNEVANALGEAVEGDSQQLVPGTWTTLSDESDLDGWPNGVTDPEETTAASEKLTANGQVCVSLAVNGQTASFTGEVYTVMRLIESIANI